MCDKLSCDRIGVVERSQHEEYVTQHLMNGNQMDYYRLKHQKECYSKLLNYHIDVAIADSSSADYFTQTKQYCQLEVVGFPFGKTDFGIVFPKRWQYKLDLDNHIMKLKEEGEIDRLLEEYFQEKYCDRKNSNNGIGNGFHLSQVYGLFVVHFGLVAVILVISILKWSFIDRKRNGRLCSSDTNTMTQPSATNDRINTNDTISSLRQRRKVPQLKQKEQECTEERQDIEQLATTIL
ncbi:unnamed protein product [Rotaria sp. Silwood2]|nr:unnamed protein product [Rotaria sp. Silwood2]